MGCNVLNSVVLARTASGSTYVLAIGSDGVHWCRLPADPSERPGIAWSASGFEPAIPRIVPGERLLIGSLRTTPVTTVSILPA
ncbi:MAG: hypothetical protein M3153_12135 [Chloroflexota bacterium]|nr:hypothetical protein [Chloroflexota bacterium]